MAQKSDSEDSRTDGIAPETRERIAISVLALSGIGIVVVAVIILVASHRYGPPEDFAETSRLVFNTLIPVFATWVGTVIAYYFSQSNFDAANRSVRRLVERITPEERLQRTPVRDVMKAIGDVKKIVVAQGTKPEDVPIEDLVTFLDPDAAGDGSFTRLPIVDHRNHVLYVIHRSVLFEHLAKEKKPAAQQKLSDLLARPRLANLIGSWSTVAEDAMLGDAKRAMESAANAQDVFVTRTGRPDEPAVGWLTNVDISRAIQKV